MDVAARLARVSTRTFLVLQLTVKDVRIARSTLDALAQRGIAEGGVLSVANHYVRRQMIGLDEATKALGVAPAAVHNDYAAAIKGLNLGRALADVSPRSVIRRDLQALIVKAGVPAAS